MILECYCCSDTLFGWIVCVAGFCDLVALLRVWFYCLFGVFLCIEFLCVWFGCLLLFCFVTWVSFGCLTVRCWFGFIECWLLLLNSIVVLYFTGVFGMLSFIFCGLCGGFACCFRVIMFMRLAFLGFYWFVLSLTVLLAGGLLVTADLFALFQLRDYGMFQLFYIVMIGGGWGFICVVSWFDCLVACIWFVWLLSWVLMDWLG